MTPGPNPSHGTIRVEKVNPENALYQAWKEASEETRPAFEADFVPLLRRHASKVCWLVLHSHHLDYIEEVVQDAIMELGKFKEESSFSTYFHARCLNRFRSLFRQQRQRKEVEFSHLHMGQPYMSYEFSDSQLLAEELLKDLPPQDVHFLRLKFREGYSERAMAVEFGLSQKGVHERWLRIQKELKEKYGVRK